MGNRVTENPRILDEPYTYNPDGTRTYQVTLFDHKGEVLFCLAPCLHEENIKEGDTIYVQSYSAGFGFVSPGDLLDLLRVYAEVNDHE